MINGIYEGHVYQANPFGFGRMIWDQKAYIGYFNVGDPNTLDFTSLRSLGGTGLYYTAKYNMVPIDGQTWSWKLKYQGVYKANQDITEEPQVKNNTVFQKFNQFE